MTLTYGTVDNVPMPLDQSSSPPVAVTSMPSNSDSDRFSEQDTHDIVRHTELSIDENDPVVDEDPEAVAARKRARLTKIIIGLILLGIVIVVIVDSTTNRYIAQGIQIFLQWFEDNPIAGLFAFMGVYFVATGESAFVKTHGLKLLHVMIYRKKEFLVRNRLLSLSLSLSL